MTDGDGMTIRRPPVHARPVDGWPSVEQLVVTSRIVTGVFVVAAAASAIAPDVFAVVGVVTSLALFVLGCVAFMVGYARAVGRSRVDELDLPGLFFLVDSVPAQTRRRLLVLVGVQLAAGVAAAAVRPFTPVAFCTLAPVFGLGTLALCSATHGHFPPRRR